MMHKNDILHSLLFKMILLHLSGTTWKLRLNLQNEIDNQNYNLKIALIGFYSMYLIPNETKIAIHTSIKERNIIYHRVNIMHQH